MKKQNNILQEAKLLYIIAKMRHGQMMDLGGGDRTQVQFKH